MAVRSLGSWLMLAALFCFTPGPVLAKETAAAPAKARGKARVQAPARPQPPQVTSILSASHPHVNQASFAAGSLLRILGSGFGEGTDTHIALKTAGIEEGVALRIMSWKDHEIVVELPSVARLGYDAATMAELAKEVHAGKPVVSMASSIDVLRGGTALLEPINLRIALAAFDFDGDGVSPAQDKNDLDPKVH